MDRVPVIVKTKVCFETWDKPTLESGTDQSFIHVEDQHLRVFLLLLAQLKRLHQQLVVVLLVRVLVLLLELVAELEQVHQIPVDQLRRILE